LGTLAIALLQRLLVVDKLVVVVGHARYFSDVFVTLVVV